MLCEASGQLGPALAGWVEVTRDAISVGPILSHKTILSRGNKSTGLSAL